MKDRIKLGNGKSSILKSPSLPETYAGFKAALEAGTQFIDIAPNNALTGDDVGVIEVGTANNKANMLSDATAQKVWPNADDRPTNPTVNDALSKLGAARVAWQDAYTQLPFGTSSAASLSTSRNYFTGASIGDYALFAGGEYGGTYYTTVDAYDIALTRTTATALSQARRSMGNANVGSYTLYAGGYRNIDDSTVDAYDTTLTRTTASTLSPGRYALAGASVGNYALFAGGINADWAMDTVNAYSTTLTQTTATALSSQRRDMTGNRVGNYALFAGGYTSGGSLVGTVEAYNSALTKSAAPALSAPRWAVRPGQVEGYALFAGGVESSATAVVEAYDSTLTKIGITPLSQAAAPAYANIGGHALFTTESWANVYDATLTRSITGGTGQSANYGNAVVGNYALFAKGYASGGSTVVAYVNSYQLKVTVPAWWMYSFSGASPITVEAETEVVAINESPINGWMSPASIVYTGQI